MTVNGVPATGTAPFTALVPLPNGVERDAVLRLDASALDTYWKYLPHAVWLKGKFKLSPAGRSPTE